MAVDDAWRPLAESSRSALRLLGWDVPECLPSEAKPCGGSHAEHTAAHLGTLRAVVAHHVSHLGQAGEAIALKASAAARSTLSGGEPCDQGHASE